MQISDALRSYFRGEAAEAWFFILPAGVLLVGVGVAVLRTERSAFDWGLAAPCLAFGLVLVSTGIGVGSRTPAQVTSLEAQLDSDPASMVAQELPRMRRVMSNFHTALIAMGVIGAVGLALRFGVRADWAVGLGSALVLVAGVGLLVDGIAERRARPYVAELEALEQLPR